VGDAKIAISAVMIRPVLHGAIKAFAMDSRIIMIFPIIPTAVEYILVAQKLFIGNDLELATNALAVGRRRRRSRMNAMELRNSQDVLLILPNRLQYSLGSIRILLLILLEGNAMGGVGQNFD
jgi:hypothetical protein